MSNWLGWEHRPHLKVGQPLPQAAWTKGLFPWCWEHPLLLPCHSTTSASSNLDSPRIET